MFRKKNSFEPLTRSERLQRDVERDNALKVESTDGIDCDICGNKKVIYYAKDGYEFCRECECMKKRRSIAHLKRSGMEQQILNMRFDNFIVSEPWQEQAKQQAQKYAANPQGWFYCGGQVGSGKTHLCTAICGELVNKCYEVRYMLWVDKSEELKAARGTPEFKPLIE